MSEFSIYLNWIDANSELFSVQNQVISKKKRSSPKFRAFFCPLTPTSTSHLTIFGGAIFVWELLKACYFAYFSVQWGGYSTILPLSSYAILYVCLTTLTQKALFFCFFFSGKFVKLGHQNPNGKKAKRVFSHDKGWIHSFCF